MLMKEKKKNNKTLRLSIMMNFKYVIVNSRTD